MSYFVIHGCGYIASEVQVRTTQDGKTITSWSMPIKYKEATQWLRCSCYGKQAEVVSSDLHKGKYISFSGLLKPFAYVDKSGQTRSGIQCEVDFYRLGYEKPKEQAAPRPQTSTPANPQTPNLDDIPF